MNPDRLIDPQHSDAEIEASLNQCLKRLETGASVILHTSRGPDDPRVRKTLERYAAMGFDDRDVRLKNGKTLGPKLGRILSKVVQQRPMKRAAVAGGDTSLFVARELGIRALTAIAPVAPGSPLCRVHADNALDGMELIFKGGQVGKSDIWQALLQGTQTKQQATLH